MVILLNKIPDRGERKHNVYKWRNQRQKNLEYYDVWQRHPAQHTFSRKNGAVLEDGLQNSKRPAEALSHEAAGIHRSFGVGQCAVFVLHAVSATKQRHRKVGVLCYRIGVVAACFTN